MSGQAGVSAQVQFSSVARAGPRATSPDNTDQVIVQIQKELRELLIEHAALLRRIGLLKRTLTGLADIFGGDISSSVLSDLLPDFPSLRHHRPGLTEACREVLREVAQPLTNRELCDRLKQSNPALLARHKTPAAAVRTVTKRLVSYGEAHQSLNERYECTWQWIDRCGTGPNGEHYLSQKFHP